MVDLLPTLGIPACTAHYVAWPWHYRRFAIQEVCFRSFIQLLYCSMEIIVFYRRPILSLIAMILRPDAYHPERTEGDAEPYMSKYDVLRLEAESDRKQGQKVARDVLKNCRLTIEQVIDELDDLGTDWKDGSGVILDLMFLKQA